MYLDCNQSQGGCPAPGVHGDHVAGGEAVHVPGGHRADGHAGDRHQVEHQVEQAGAAWLTAVVEHVDKSGWNGTNDEYFDEKCREINHRVLGAHLTPPKKCPPPRYAFFDAKQYREQRLLKSFCSEWQKRYTVFEKKLLGY